MQGIFDFLTTELGVCCEGAAKPSVVAHDGTE